MSGTHERVVFIHDRPGDEALITGGTMARLRSDGASVAVLFGRSAPSDRERWLREAFADERATAVVIGSVDDDLVDTATRVAQSMVLPVFLARRVTQAVGRRLTAIDVSDEIDEKLRALAAYPDRWTIVDNAVALPDGSLLAVTGTETYLRVDPPPHALADIPPTPLSRLITGATAFVAGAVFGLLGTIAHQSVIRIGPVTIPIGLILSLVAVTALLVGLRMVFRDRVIVLACAIGMLGTIFVLSLRSVGGSVLIPAGLPGTLWTIVPTLVATFVLAWPNLPAKRSTGRG